MQLMAYTNEITVFYFGSIGDYKKSLPSTYKFEKDYTTGKLWREIQSKIDYSGDILVAGSEVFGSKKPSQVIKDFYANARSIKSI